MPPLKDRAGGLATRLLTAAAPLPGDLRRAARLLLNEGPGAVAERAGETLLQLSSWAPERHGARRLAPRNLLIEVASLDRGGLEEVVFQLATRLDRDRWTPKVACVERGGWVAQRLNEHGVSVHVLSGDRGAYSDLLASEQIDVVNSHYSLFGAPLARRAGIPNVHVLHNSYLWVNDVEAARLARRFRDISRFVAVSASVKRYAEERFHLPEARLQVIENGLDLRRKQAHVSRHEARRQLGLPSHALVFLTLGTYEGRKGYLSLLAAFARFAAREPRAFLVAAGNTVDPDFLAQLRRFVAQRSLGDRVQLLDFAAQPEELYAAADAFVLPSVVEGFSLSTLEALAAGLPLLLTDVGAAREVIEATGAGLLMPAPLPDLARASAAQIARAYSTAPEPDVAALASAMERLARELPELRSRAAAATGLLTTRFELGHVVKRYAATFESCLT